MVYESETLIVKKITEYAYIHISYLQTNDFGKVPCNGMLLVDGNETFVLETPTDDAASQELIKWISNELQSDVKGVIVHHFHIDCLGGLNAFHNLNVPSYANEKTISLARKEGYVAPQNGIKDGMEFRFGEQIFTTNYFGPAHTVDNIASYFPSEEILFGGCMIKSLKSGKGNLEDADPDQWPVTVRKIQTKYPGLKKVVPGHGKEGDMELLSYTIELFQE